MIMDMQYVGFLGLAEETAAHPARAMHMHACMSMHVNACMHACMHAFECVNMPGTRIE